MGLWFASQTACVVPRGDAIGQEGRTDLSSTSDRRSSQSGQHQLDETGWRVAARLQWLWVCVSAEVTIYAILPGRGFAQAASMLGEDYDGFLNHDAWHPYYRFIHRFHQTGCSILSRPVEALTEPPWSTAARSPQPLTHSLLEGWALRDA